MSRRVEAIMLSPEERGTLDLWTRGKRLAQRLVQRARIIRMAADGVPSQDIARGLKISRPTVQLWRQRFLALRLAGLEKDAPRPGRIPRIPAEKIQAVVNATLHQRPANATHWSTRSMAAAQGVSEATVRRIWRQHGLKPHLVKTFKLSRDRSFVEKLVDVVGLYLNPPDKSLVLSVDEKSQIQALDRTQPSLPLKKGRCGTMTHDYKRNGTTTLFAALSMLDGKVIGQCQSRHRHQEFLKFLRRLDREFPGDWELHLVLDNYGTHKTPEVQKWMKRHGRFVLHFIPTSSSWLNLVERWFRELTQKAVRRGAFFSVPDLIAAIEAFLAGWNENPRPFVWTAKLEEILKKIERAREKLESIQPGSTQPRRRRKGEE